MYYRTEQITLSWILIADFSLSEKKATSKAGGRVELTQGVGTGLKISVQMGGVQSVHMQVGKY